MLPSRNHRLIRALALLLLLWVGFDVGAHGLVAADFGPTPSCGCDTSVSGNSDGAAAPAPVECHCFCHAVSVGAVLPALAGALAPASAIVLAPPTQVARGDRDPLYHPPQPNA